jgi:hypothetical protein
VSESAEHAHLAGAGLTGEDEALAGFGRFGTLFDEAFFLGGSQSSWPAIRWERLRRDSEVIEPRAVVPEPGATAISEGPP